MVVMHLVMPLVRLLVMTISLLLFSNQAFATVSIPLESTNWLSNPLPLKGSESASYPKMAVQDDNIYVAWVSSGIMFSRSIDGGNTFSEPITLADSPNISASEAYNVKADKDNVYVVYTTSKEVFLLRSDDKGASFSSAINVSRMNIEPGSAALVYFPVISIAGNNVYVAWMTSSHDWSEIFFAKSHDRGAGFGEKINVSNNPEYDAEPKLASFDKYVYLAWSHYPVDTTDPEIRHVSFARSTDGGTTFETRSNFSASESDINSDGVQVAVDEKGAYLVWTDSQYIENTGHNFVKTAFAKIAHSDGELHITKYIVDGLLSSFAVSNGKVYVVVDGLPTELGRVEFVRSLDGGLTFSSPQPFSNQTWSQSVFDASPIYELAANGPNVFIAWRYTENSDQSSTHVTYLAASYDRGETFTPPISASKGWGDTDRDSRILVSASTKDRLFLLWHAIHGSEPALWLVRGQIPEQYAAPYREVSFMTPVEQYNLGEQYVPIIGIGAMVAGIIAFLTLRKRKQSNTKGKELP